MLWNGKIIGLFAGAILGGSIGAVIGLAIGHLFDIGVFDGLFKRFGFSRHASRAVNVQQIFFSSTFTVMGHIAKSDGRVSENEIHAAKRIMSQLNLNAAMKQEAIQLFNEGKQSDFSVDTALNQLKHACWRHPSLLRTFLDIQLQMAYADGQQISPKKQAALQYVYSQLGIRGFSFHQFQNRYRAEQNYQRNTDTPRYDSKQHRQNAYKILEISSTATDSEVKKAYRRQMSKNHPDKLISKGLPPEMIKVATQKTQQIKDAYETIKKSRGLK